MVQVIILDITMDMRVVLLIFAFITFQLMVDAAFFFNPIPLTPEKLDERGLKCIPGRTIIKIEEKKLEQNATDDSEEETRRSHMNAETKDESCKICVCSTEGKDEYCSRRPARNVNECIRMAILKKNMMKHLPFAHERSLAFRIRRDYIWHYDEIPYEAKASCKRSTSYYSNNVNANNTDIDLPSDIDSLLDYSNKDVCYYCVCSTDGRHAGCISRDPWYCEYYRIIREPDAPRNRYRDLFKQDRPAYFRQLSYRLRRNMDDGIVAIMELVGDGKRDKCIPYVSEYSDCTDANSCSGCKRCTCTSEGDWQCEDVLNCPPDEEDSEVEKISSALDGLYSELKIKEKNKSRELVPPPPKPEDELLVPDYKYYEEDFDTFVSRQKRSVNDKSNDNEQKNHTVNFFHTIDELNEDTLKGTNKSGTIQVTKVDTKNIPNISRRKGLLDNFNKSDLNSLQIEYNPQDYDHHIAENKIESISPPADAHFINKYKIRSLIGNYSQNIKDKELSKLVVNELKRGKEIIGDKNVSPMSNITFTSENDTLTAMAFIAGNLLNKLWEMEKESSDSSDEVETLKHKKINDLLELFKEPLSIRQETFLKNALEKLSETLHKNKNVKNVSLCETIVDHDVSDNEKLHKKGLQVNKNSNTNCTKEKSNNNTEEKNIKKGANNGAITKLNNVLNLMKKFEQVQKNLSNLRYQTLKETDGQDDLTLDENSSLHMFGNLLEKITELLIPNDGSKKVIRKLKNLNQFSTNDNSEQTPKNKFNIDLHQNNLTIKDKILLDYLNHIENNPNCLFSKKYHKTDENKISIEGNILNNLSEFFKIKSIIDLYKLTSTGKESTDKQVRQTTESIKRVIARTDALQETAHITLKVQKSKTFNTTKEKLKNHLRAIIDDLIELQNENDPKSRNKINILDALPCIYKMLNTHKDNKENETSSKRIESQSLIKIKALIDSLKIEFTPNVPSRRSNLASTERSQSAKVWERIIKNINSLQKNTRRNFNFKKPKSYQDIKNLMETVELTSNSYKNFAVLSVIPPQKRLMLLKTLEADTRQKTFALENIRDSLDTLYKFPPDTLNELKEFIDNTENNIKLNAKVVKNLDTSKEINNNKDIVEVFEPNKNNNKQAMKMKDLLKAPETLARKGNNIKLTRDQIMSLLIENRIKFYLASKEATDTDLGDDVNYKIAKKILSFIREGNIVVAKELFKVFVANKRGGMTDDTASPATLNSLKRNSPLLLALKEPLIRFDEPGKETKAKSPETLFKQLLTLKNINVK